MSEQARGDGREDLLESLVTLSERMLADAEAARWDAVMAQEATRQHLVWTLFAAPLGRDEQRRWARPLQRVVAVSRRLTDLAVAARTRRREELLGLRRGRKQRQSYERLVGVR
jgi:hypothetical protein